MAKHELIAKARIAYEGGDPFWPRPLVAALLSQELGAALQWGCLVVSALLPNLDPEQRRQLEKDAAELNVRALKPGDPSALWSKSEEVWARPDRDNCQTAIARLFAALAYRQQSQVQGYAREIESALAVLGRDERFTRQVMNQVLEGFMSCLQMPVSTW